MTATLTTVERVLKELYSPSRLEYLLYKSNPFLGLLPKNTSFGGNSLRIPIMYASTSGRSSAFATAQTNRAGARYSGFNLTRVEDYSIFSISNHALKASRGDKAAFVSVVESETRAAMNSIEQSISRSLFGNGGGALGVIGSGQGTPTLTLADRQDIVNFQVGDVLVASTTDGTSGAALAPTATLIAVDRSAGTITTTGNFDAAFADANFLFHQGDFGAKLSGLEAWLPATAPSGGDSFFGVDRSVDTSRLAGVRYTATVADDETIDQALVNAGAELLINGGTPDTIVMHPVDYAILTNDARDRTTFDKEVSNRTAPGGKAVLSYKVLTLMLPCGEVKIIADKHCPRGVAYMLQLDTWKLHSLDGFPHMFDSDGSRMLREESADAVQGRIVAYGNLACSAPGYNCRIDISAFA